MRKKTVTAATIGTRVHDARIAAGLSQSELGKRIGASRFWVAEFEKGKPTVELGLALKALHSLGLSLRIEPHTLPEIATGQAVAPGDVFRLPADGVSVLGQVVASATQSSAAPSAIGWPSVHATREPNSE